MILDSPVKGTIHVDAENYPSHSVAWNRPGGNRDPSITHDFGPSTVKGEPEVKWPGGETDIYGNRIPAGTYSRFHCGVDFYCGGSRVTIYASADGTVVSTANLDHGSRSVVIRHADGIATGSSHMTSFVVKQGQEVKRGQKIGTMGNTGKADGVHDHFAVKVGFPSNVTGVAAANAFYRDVSAGTGGKGRFVNPLRFLRQFVTVHPDGSTVNLRTTPGKGATKGPVYAQSKADGRIHRESDDADLGATATFRDWRGTVTGATYEGRSDWHAMELAIPGGKPITVYVAAKYAVLSSD